MMQAISCLLVIAAAAFIVWLVLRQISRYESALMLISHYHAETPEAEKLREYAYAVRHLGPFEKMPKL